MAFQVLDPMIAQWSIMASRLLEATDDLSDTSEFHRLSQREQRTVLAAMKGQQELTAKACDAMRNLRDSLASGEDTEISEAIGDLSGSFAFQAFEVIQTRANDHTTDRANRDTKAFEQCREIARILKEEIIDSLAAEQRASRLSHKMHQALHQHTIANMASSETIADPELRRIVEQARSDYAASARTFNAITALGLKVSEQVARVVNEIHLPLLDDAIAGNLEAIVRQYERLQQLGTLGPGLLGGVVDMLGAPSGIGSIIGTVVGAITNIVASPVLRRKQQKREEVYRNVAVFTISLFLIPFTACVLGHLRVMEENAKAEVMALGKRPPFNVA